MFVRFFYELKNSGIPVTTTSFLTLHRALLNGLICNLNDFYISSRCILIKNERFFDIFDQIFAYYFHGVEFQKTTDSELNIMAHEMLKEWLKNPEELANIMDIKPSTLKSMNPEELIEYFKKRLKDQTERHSGGSKWIGTGGTSPVGHSGAHKNGMRIGGVSRNKSAVKVAMERRYKDYNMSGSLKQSMIGEALKKLKKLVPAGPKDQINIDKTIASTTKNGGEIEIHFDRKLIDRLKIILAIDNGGWSMEPYVSTVSTLFRYSRSQFKDFKTYYFHNTIYETIWEDPERQNKPIQINELIKKDQNTRLIIVGDASMAPYELMSKNGSIYWQDNGNKSSIDCLSLLAKTLPHSVWLNPIPTKNWNFTRTISIIKQVFPMFELSLDGLEKAITQLTLG